MANGETNQFNLPENTPSLANQITQATIQEFGDAPAEDLATVRRLRGGNELTSRDVEIKGPSSAQLFPGLNTPVQIGQTSGSIIGSQPIFAATGSVVPLGVVQQRQFALQQVAAKRAEELKPFDIPKGPTVKDPRFQESLNRSVSDTQERFINRARQQFGKDAFVALRSPETKIGREFLQAMDNLDVLARESDQVVDLFAEVESGLESGDLTFSDETLALKREFEQLTGSFEGGDIAGLGSLRNNLNELRGSLDLDKLLNDRGLLSRIKGQLVERAGVSNFNEYFKVATRSKKTFDRDAAVIAKNLKEGNAAIRQNPFWTTERIANHLKAILGSEDKQDVSITQKSEAILGLGKDEEGINNRIRTIQTLQKAFFDENGNITDTPNDAAQSALGTLIGSNVPGIGKVISAEFSKGEALFKKPKRDKEGKVVRDTKGNPVLEGSVSPEQANDGIILMIAPKNAEEAALLESQGKTGKEHRIDLTDRQSFFNLNQSLNTSPSEDLKVKNEDIQKQQSTTQPNRPQNLRRVSRKTLAAAAARQNMTPAEFIKKSKDQKNIIIQVTD